MNNDSYIEILHIFTFIINPKKNTMYKSIFSLLVFILISSISFAQSFAVKIHKDKHGYEYKTVDGDPFGVREYQLKNGLKVYLSENKEKPVISTMIAVKAGSTYDPKDNTGLAHYLEHLMFKGTSKIGTVDWDKEKVLLDEISDLFEEHKAATDPEKKKEIYAKIDKLSTEAAEYAAPSEYDKMISSIGARGTNAFTSNEHTVYVNTIPSNQLDKWMTVEGERFSELVLRLFHTELETVYEEFNSGQSSDFRQAYYKYNSLLFPTHPYGQQTTIGKAEHLKNPSMVNIHKYWEKYYVANNMAVIMSGDLDFDETIQKIDKYFGHLRKDEKLSHPTFEKEKPITKPIDSSIYGPEAEFVKIGFRTQGANDEDNLIAELISMILYNGKAGLIDLDLIKSQKVLRASVNNNIMRDYGNLSLTAYPLEGQKLEDVKELLLGELDKIKKGEFEDWLPEAIINNKKLSTLRKIEYNYYIYDILNSFTLDVPWNNEVSRLDRMSKIKKQQIIDYANKYFHNNYVVVYKRKGENKDVVKVEKPNITPLKLDRTKESEFLKNFNKLPENRLKPMFVDFKKMIKTEYVNNVEFNYIQNKNNELSTAYFVLDMGDFNIKDMSIALNYFRYIGTKSMSADQLAKEYFKLGVYTGVSASEERTYVYVSGLQKNFEKALKLFIENIKSAKADNKSFKKYIETVKKKRANRKLSKAYINYNEKIYAKYGKNNPQRYALTNKELDELDADKMVERINNLLNYEHYILYYGPKSYDEAKALIFNAYSPSKNLLKIPKPVKFEELENGGKVYFTNYDMVQSSIALTSKEEVFNSKLWPYISMFNEFYGSGLSSIVFQELRESKGLVYYAYAYLTVPSEKEKSHYLEAALYTQPDKMEAAMKAMLGILNSMPEAKESFEASKKAALIKIESKRYTKSDPFWYYKLYQKLGIDYSIEKESYEKIKNMTYEDFQNFFKKHIADKKFDIIIMGNKEAIDFKALKKYGELTELSIDDLFIY